MFTTNIFQWYHQGIMVANRLPKITALEAQAAANLFLSDHLPDRFLAVEPRFEAASQVWRVLVVIAYPVIGPIGEVGEISVSALSEEIIAYTALEEMQSHARRLYEEHREAIKAAFLQTRNS